MALVPTAGVVACDDHGRLLMVRRADDGTWAVPAGRLEIGESWLECATREFEEETGLVVEVTGLLGVYSEPAVSRHTYPDGCEVQFLGVIFEGRVEGIPPPPTSTDEILAVEYFATGELPEPLFEPDRILIEDAFSERSRPVVR